VKKPNYFRSFSSSSNGEAKEPDYIEDKSEGKWKEEIGKTPITAAEVLIFWIRFIPFSTSNFNLTRQTK
jgi:hypothetical protein